MLVYTNQLPTIYVCFFVVVFFFTFFPNFTIHVYSNIFITSLDDTRMYTFVMLCKAKEIFVRKEKMTNKIVMFYQNKVI